ncbi:ribonuclease III domain-containing protein [Aspergillus venezuelensis]
MQVVLRRNLQNTSATAEGTLQISPKPCRTFGPRYKPPESAFLWIFVPVKEHPNKSTPKMPSIIALPTFNPRTTMAERAAAFQVTFGLKFNGPDFLIQALTAPGALGATTTDGNKALAHIGDSGLDLVLRVEGYKRGLTLDQIGPMTAAIVCNKNLAKRGFALGLERYIRNNPSQGNMISERTMASTVEAIVGAYFLDQGMCIEALGRVVRVLGLGWPGDDEEGEEEKV